MAQSHAGRTVVGASDIRQQGRGQRAYGQVPLSWSDPSVCGTGPWASVPWQMRAECRSARHCCFFKPWLRLILQILHGQHFASAEAALSGMRQPVTVRTPQASAQLSNKAQLLWHWTSLHQRERLGDHWPEHRHGHEQVHPFKHQTRGHTAQTLSALKAAPKQEAGLWMHDAYTTHELYISSRAGWRGISSSL